MDDFLSLLNSLGIKYGRYDHPAVFSCEESDRLCPPMPGAHTKQLLMKPKGKDVFLLAIVMHDKKVDTKTFAKEFGFKSFSFAQPEQLKRLLGVEPGSVTPLGLIFDKAHEVKVIIDEDAWNIGVFRFHPLTNTATLVMDQTMLKKFFEYTGHSFDIRSIPTQKNLSH